MSHVSHFRLSLKTFFALFVMASIFVLFYALPGRNNDTMTCLYLSYITHILTFFTWNSKKQLNCHRLSMLLIIIQIFVIL